MNRRRGFTILETIIASTIIATIMLGMIGLLATHSKSANKFKDATFAANLAQQEIDIILADLKVQRSLASYDTQGRAARHLLYENRATNVTVAYMLDFFLNNFREVNHDYPDDVVFDEEKSPIKDEIHWFNIENGNRFYDGNGEFLGQYGKVSVAGARFVTRVQVFGLPNVDYDGKILNDRQLPLIEKDTAHYLMGDTDNGSDLDTLSWGIPMRKLIVVKVYEYADYIAIPDKSLAKIPDRKILARMKLVVFGDS